MKKQFLLVVGLLFLCPLTAAAGLIGTSSMTMTVNMATGYEYVNFTSGTPISANFYIDYEIYVKPTTLPVAVVSTEAYCLENVDMARNFSTEYDFFTSNTLSTTSYNYKLVTWLADYGEKNADNKGLAQLAIWNVVLGATSTSDNNQSVNTLIQTGLSASDLERYVNDWLVAVSPTTAGGTNYQNFLVKAPVPEPTTTMLFALGVVGFAGIARRRVSSN